MSTKFFYLTWLLFCFALVMPRSQASAAGQLEEVAESEIQAVQVPVQLPTPGPDNDAETPEKQPVEDDPITDTAVQPPEAPLAEQHIRFHMWDGSIIGGEVAAKKISVQTEFGALQIPIKDILKFYPGLDSIPVLNAKISELVDGLGDKNFDTRERSHRELVAMGLQLRDEIRKFDDGGSAERKKHLTEIKQQIAELSDEQNYLENEDVERALIRGDLIVTQTFSIVGKIDQEQFQVASKFGGLNVKLADIKMADRAFNQGKAEIRKLVKVDATAFFQTKPTSTLIRVNRGDKISIRATGIVQWTNWSTSSGPDGIENQGQWQGAKGGTLMARIGNGNEYIKIGSEADFTARQSGVLFLGIAVQDNYASNNGYRWDGKYDAKIIVKPSE